MHWPRAVGYAGLLLGCWAGLAAWQHHEYGHECELARQALVRQGDSVMNALVGGIRYHRRLGRFFPSQIQEALSDLISADVRAAALVSEDGNLVLTAGESGLLDALPPVELGRLWTDQGLRYAVDFRLEPQPGEGLKGPAGRGPGRGWGRQGRGPEAWETSPLATGGRFAAVLLLDRTPTDAFCRRAWWVRFWLVAAGGVVLVCVGVAWWATVRWTEAQGRAKVLEAEARHLRDLSQAAAGLAHETRNPLGLIRGWTQRLAEGEPHRPELQQQARAIIEECDRVTSRINQFLAFARPCTPSPTAVDPGELVDELAVLVEPDLEARQLRLQVRGTLGGRTIRADREMLRQALFNLVRNAIQFSPPQTEVEIALVPAENGQYRIEVADRGPGVPAEQVDSLFTPYFTTRPDGTGLGLAIVRRIAGAHGWQSGYRPRPGGGSIFWLDRIHG
ncbi:MAG: sensor histidine kinase [Thermoguttaceae bacterium]